LAQVSISEAARLAGISRGGLYKTYLSKGVISVSTNSAGKKSIDTSELLRVFGELKGDSNELLPSEQEYTGELSPNEQVETVQDIEIKMLREQVAELKADKAFYQTQVTELTSTMKLLEAPKHSEPIYPRLWWQFWK
jgi:hypothetical protein